MHPTVIIVFSKTLNNSQAKTRLRKEYPHDTVTALHNAMVSDTISLAESLATELVLFWDSAPETTDRFKHQSYVQQGASFGERFQNAFEKSYELYPKAAVIIVGSDCPLLTEKILIEAIAQLAEEKPVIGPSQEGGFYLLGIPPRQRDVDFSDCFQSDYESLKVKEKLVSDNELVVLPFLFDIDTPEDLRSLKALSVLSPNCILPETSTFLKTFEEK